MVPYQPVHDRQISLKRKTATGKIVKELNFSITHKSVPRSPAWCPGVPLPAVEACTSCVPPLTGWSDLQSLLTCGWFYFKSEDGESLDRVYEQIGLMATLFAVIVQGMLSAAKDISNDD